MTHVCVLTVELLIWDSTSLKAKRSVVRQTLARTRNKFPVAAAEVDQQNDPSRATLAFAALASDAQIAHATSQKVLAFIEELRIDCEVGAVSVEEIAL